MSYGGNKYMKTVLNGTSIKRKTINICLIVMTFAFIFLMSGCNQDETTPKEKPIQFTLPKPTGSYNVGMTEIHLVDKDREDPWVKNQNRELMISIWYPAQKGYKGTPAPYMQPKAADLFGQKIALYVGQKQDRIDWANFRTNAWLDAPIENNIGPLPVVLYSPGFGLPRTASTALVTELASQGYIVVTVDHTYETAAVEFPNSRVEVETLPEDSKERLKKAFEVRVHDIRFVLDQLTAYKDGENSDAPNRDLPTGLNNILDLTKIGIFGHSAGGYTAASAMYVDQRIIAGIDMDGSLGYEEKDGTVSFPAAPNGLDRPFMLLTANNSHQTAPSMKLLWENSSGWKLDLNVPKGEHFTFTDYEVLLPYLENELDLPDEFIMNSIGTPENPTRM